MKLISAFAIAAISGSAFAGVGIQTNGGFELGSGADSDGWEEVAGGPAGTVSERFFGMAASGDYSHRISAVGDDTAGASAVLIQNTQFNGLDSLAPGSSVSLSFDAATNFGPGGVGFYVLRVLDASGAIVADTGLQNLAATGGYQSYSTAALTVPAFGAAPSDYYAAFVEISVAAGAFDGSSAEAFIDNVVISGTVVPAPGALGMLALGGLVAGRRRR